MVMMMKLKWILLGTVMILMGGVSAEGQSIIRNPFLGARNVALASANMAEPHDISSIYGDPATIAFLENPSVVLNQLQGNEGEMQENLAFPLVYDRSQMLAFGAELYTLGEFTSTSQARRYAIGYDIAFAQKVASTVSVGGSVSFRHGVIPQLSRANAASYTLGIDYVPNEDVSYGLALGGLGTGVEFVNDNSIVTPVQVTLPRVLQVSAVMRFPTESSLERPFLVMALASEKAFGTPGVDYKGGLEYYPVRFLALRFGYVAGPVASGQRFGVGLRLGLFALDFAAYPATVTGSRVLFGQMSISKEF
jgi:hypothetical protein